MQAISDGGHLALRVCSFLFLTGQCSATQFVVKDFVCKLPKATVVDSLNDGLMMSLFCTVGWSGC